MGILLALGAGKLWSRDSPPPCPLERVDLIAAGGALLVDNQARRCAWRGRCFTCAPGIEDALCWGQRPLLLSGEADCLTLHAPDGTPEWTLHAGMEPRQLCLLPGGRCLAVAGGLSGEIRLVRLPELTPLRSFPVPGAALCLAVQRGWLYVACAVGEEEIHCLLCRLSLRTGRLETLRAFPGLPGALAAGPEGALYLGATERLYRFTGDPPQLGALREGFGLPRRILPLGGQVLVADPVLEQALVLDAMLQKKPVTLYRGEVQDACITSSVPGNPSP